MGKVAKFSLNTFTRRSQIHHIFLFYTFSVAIIFVLFVTVVGLTIIRQKRNTTNLIKIYKLLPEFSFVEKKQIELFSDSYRYIPEKDFFPIKNSLEKIILHIDELKDDRVISRSVYINSLVSEIEQYKSVLERIAKMNYRYFNPMDGKVATLNRYLNQFEITNVFLQPPFKDFTRQIIDLNQKYQSKNLSIEEFERKLLKIESQVKKIPEKDAYTILVKQRFLFLLQHISNLASEIINFKNIYGVPFSSGLFKELDLHLNQAITYDLKLGEDVKYDFVSRIKYLLSSIVLLLILFVLDIVFFFYYILNGVVPVITKVKENLRDLSTGKLVDIEVSQASEEAFRITKYLKTHVESLKDKRKIIEQLAQRNYDVEIKLLSFDDELGKSLQALRDALRQRLKEAEQVREEENKQKWMTEGLAHMSDIMRESAYDLQTLFENTLKGLLEFIDAPMGAFYYKEEIDGEVFYQLKIAYAYNKKRIPKLKYRLTEGFVGTVAAEKRILKLEPVPDNYLFYETAFGYAKPTSIVFVPIITQDEVIGVLEIAALYSFPDHYLQFLEKFASDYAATIVFVKINEQTKSLLSELRQKTKLFEQKEQQYKQQIQQLTEQKQKLEQEISRFKKLCLDKDRIIMNNAGEVNKLKQLLDEKEKQLQQAIERFEQAELRYQKYIESLEDTIKKLNEELEKLRKQNK